jgi:hypothetical protein
MIRKEILIVLVTFCLTAALFSIISVGSQGAREYDPWYDINDDGKIDLRDYFGVGLKYATSGDPAKNVTVTNWPDANSTRNVNVTDWPNSTDCLVWWNAAVDNTGIVSNFLSAKGFAQLHVLAAGVVGGGNITVEVRGLLYDLTHTSSTSAVAYKTTLKPYPQSNAAFSIPVPSEHFYFWAYAGSASVLHLYLSYYLTWA